MNSLLYKGQSNKNRTLATMRKWNLFYSKVIATSVNTFIPLGDETINSSLVERGRSLMDPQPHPLLHFLVRIKPTSTNVILQVVKNVEITRGKILAVRRMLKCFPAKSLKLTLTTMAVWWRALSCKKMISSDSIPGRFDLMARRNTLSHEKNEPHLSAFVWLPSFPMLDEHTLHYAHL